MGNPIKTCLACGQTDDHPRHTHVLLDHSEVGHHFDCGARMEPPCESCTQRSAGSAGKTGEAMRQFLLTNNLDVGAAPVQDSTPEGNDA